MKALELTLNLRQYRLKTDTHWSSLNTNEKPYLPLAGLRAELYHGCPAGALELFKILNKLNRHPIFPDSKLSFDQLINLIEENASIIDELIEKSRLINYKGYYQHTWNDHINGIIRDFILLRASKYIIYLESKLEIKAIMKEYNADPSYLNF